MIPHTSALNRTLTNYPLTSTHHSFAASQSWPPRHTHPPNFVHKRVVAPLSPTSCITTPTRHAPHTPRARLICLPHNTFVRHDTYRQAIASSSSDQVALISCAALSPKRQTRCWITLCWYQQHGCQSSGETSEYGRFGTARGLSSAYDLLFPTRRVGIPYFDNFG